jgi:hypothetical protein
VPDGQVLGDQVPGGQLPGGQGQQGQQGVGPNGQGFGGGSDGEQHLVGTLTAVSGSTVTVTSGAASATYSITAQTQILRNGALATTKDLRAGDRVLVHVFPAANSDGVLERLITRSGSTRSGPSSSSSTDDGTTT